MTLGQIAAAVGARLRGGDANTQVTGVATLQNAQPQQISFLTNSRYRQYLATTRACAVILSPRHVDHCALPALVSANPHATYARTAALFTHQHRHPCGIHPTAVVSSSAQIAESAWVGPLCTVAEDAIIERGVFIGPHCVIDERVVLGAETFLVANVTVCHDVCIGQRVVIHPGVVIGSDGFGLADEDGHWIKVPQLGGVKIGDEVEIGANTTIDRGTLEDTILEEDVKLDNQIQIAHNVHIGAHTAIAGCVGIAGSVRIGRHCSLAGGVGIAGHLEIVDHVHITGMSLVTRSITQPGTYSSGIPVTSNRLWNKISARLRKLDDFARRLTALEKTLRADNDT
jgi:UDP-3-O-[3-hydroxymyristoyl] glucosamine N-acyltransferase